MLLTALLHFTAPAMAEPPGPVTAQLVAPSQREAISKDALSKGAVGDQAQLACQDLVQELQLCYRVQVAEGVRWISRADLAGWGVDDVGLQAAAARGLTESPLQRRAIEGGGSWWEVRTTPGHETALLLHPEWLAELGPEVLVGLPAPGVAIVWVPGNPEVDKIMAVAVRRTFEQVDKPITPLVLRWSPLGWRTWGQATPSPAGPAP